MKLRAFGVEFTVQKENSPEAIKAHLLDKLEHNALMGLEGARIELAVKKELLSKKDEHGRTESEITGMENGIEIEQKTIWNYQTQIAVINNLEEYEMSHALAEARKLLVAEAKEEEQPEKEVVVPAGVRNYTRVNK